MARCRKHPIRAVVDPGRGGGHLGIVALKKCWEKDCSIWKKRKITDRYVHLFADGVHVSVRLGEDKGINPGTRLCSNRLAESIASDKTSPFGS